MTVRIVVKQRLPVLTDDKIRAGGWHHGIKTYTRGTETI